MPGPNLIQSVGGQAQKQSHFVSLFTSRFFNGLFTNRSLLRGPLGFLYTDYYHAGTTDVLCDGLNTELSTQLTMIRRPGNPKFSSVNTNGAIDSFYSFHQGNGTIQVIADSSVDVEVMTPSSLTSIWTKTTGAGESYFAGVNQTLYIGDGVDLVKYIPSTINASNQFGQGAGNSVWLFSPVAPLTAPTLTITESGSSGVAWAASTFFSTMGLIVDSNNDIEQLVGVNALLNNATQFGTSGTGSPAWSQVAGGVVTDNTITWTNQGQITLWAPNTTYASGAPIYDPITNTIQIMSRSVSRPSGSTRPKFSTVLETVAVDDGNSGARWRCLGAVNQTPTAVRTWTPSTVFGTYIQPSSGNDPNVPNCAVVEPQIPTAANLAAGAVIFLQGATTGGTTSASFVSPFIVGNATGNTSIDNQLLWYNLGPKNWVTGTAYTAWPGVNNAFSAVIDTNSTAANFWVCINSGISTGTIPFPTSGSVAYGTIIAETNGVTWSCAGPITNSKWRANSSYYLPAVGFSPATSTNPFGGAIVFDNNSTVDAEFCVSSGFSGTSQPTWATTKGSLTTDNNGGGTDVGVQWYNGGTFSGLGFSFTKGYGYVYAYKSRSANDPDVTIAPPLATVVPNNPNVTGPLGPPTGAQDGSVSTASPVGFFGSPTPAPNAGAIITVHGKYSLDPAVDTIMIFRSTDGFQTSGPYLLVTEIPNNTALATDPSIPTTGLFSVFDFMPDTPSVIAGVTFPGLNELIEAPIDDANDPVPGQFGSTQFQQLVGSPTPNPLDPFTSTALNSGSIGLTYHQGRLWSFIGNNVFASGGPDTVVGNGFTAWPPSNVFPFQSSVSRILSTTSGLLVFTTTALYIIGGGPAITTYYSQLLVDGLGLLSWNLLALMASVPYVFASDRQLIGIEPGTGIVRVGHPIGDQLVNFSPTASYLTYHSYGDLDHALFISDGSTKWFRCDTNLAPDSQSVGPVWSPMATIAGGFKAIASIETSPGTRQLLIGPASAGPVLARDSTFNIFSDAGAVGTGSGGSAYSSFFTMGSIVLATAGQKAEMGFLEMDFTQIGSQPAISVLLDEIAAVNGATFELISNSRVSDPPKLYGPTATPASLWMNRYYFDQTTVANTPNQTPAPAWCKHLQIKVDYGNTDTVKNELQTFTIWGALWSD
jgi:hypothetical protein